MLRLEHFRWGTMDWLASGNLGNSFELSLARMYIEPGMGAGWHCHSNCEEAVVLLKGAVRCAIDDRLVELQPCGSVVIPRGAAHELTNIGRERAIVLLSYSSAERHFHAVDGYAPHSTKASVALAG